MQDSLKDLNSPNFFYQQINSFSLIQQNNNLAILVINQNFQGDFQLEQIMTIKKKLIMEEVLLLILLLFKAYYSLCVFNIFVVLTPNCIYFDSKNNSYKFSWLNFLLNDKNQKNNIFESDQIKQYLEKVYIELFNLIYLTMGYSTVKREKFRNIMMESNLNKQTFLTMIKENSIPEQKYFFDNNQFMILIEDLFQELNELKNQDILLFKKFLGHFIFRIENYINQNIKGCFQKVSLGLMFDHQNAVYQLQNVRNLHIIEQSGFSIEQKAAFYYRLYKKHKKLNQIEMCQFYLQKSIELSEIIARYNEIFMLFRQANINLVMQENSEIISIIKEQLKSKFFMKRFTNLFRMNYEYGQFLIKFDLDLKQAKMFLERALNIADWMYEQKAYGANQWLYYRLIANCQLSHLYLQLSNFDQKLNACITRLNLGHQIITGNILKTIEENYELLKTQIFQRTQQSLQFIQNPENLNFTPMKQNELKIAESKNKTYCLKLFYLKAFLNYQLQLEPEVIKKTSQKDLDQMDSFQFAFLYFYLIKQIFNMNYYALAITLDRLNKKFQQKTDKEQIYANQQMAQQYFAKLKKFLFEHFKNSSKNYFPLTKKTNFQNANFQERRFILLDASIKALIIYYINEINYQCDEKLIQQYKIEQAYTNMSDLQKICEYAIQYGFLKKYDLLYLKVQKLQQMLNVKCIITKNALKNKIIEEIQEKEQSLQNSLLRFFHQEKIKYAEEWLQQLIYSSKIGILPNQDQINTFNILLEIIHQNYLSQSITGNNVNNEEKLQKIETFYQNIIQLKQNIEINRSNIK